MKSGGGRYVGAIVLAALGGVLLAAWMLAITVIVVRSIGRHTE